MWSKIASSIRDLTSPPECAMRRTRGLSPSISIRRKGECHVVINTSACAISARNCGELSRPQCCDHSATSLKRSRAAWGKKCEKSTSLASTSTRGLSRRRKATVGWSSKLSRSPFVITPQAACDDMHFEIDHDYHSTSEPRSGSDRVKLGADSACDDRDPFQFWRHLSR